jgi:hypothetical protein
MATSRNDCLFCVRVCPSADGGGDGGGGATGSGIGGGAAALSGALRGIITVSDDRGCVFVPEPVGLARVLPYDVDAGYREGDALTDVFDGAVRPLVDAVVGFSTGSAICVVTGEDSAGKSLTLEGRPSVSLPGERARIIAHTARTHVTRTR